MDRKSPASPTMRTRSGSSLALGLPLLAVVCCNPGFFALAAPSIAAESAGSPVQGCSGCQGSISGAVWTPKPGWPDLSGFLTATDGDCVGENCRPAVSCSVSDALSPLTLTGVGGPTPIYRCETLYIPGPPISKGPRRCTQVGTQVLGGALVWVPPQVACDASVHFELLIGGLSGSGFALDVAGSARSR